MTLEKQKALTTSLLLLDQNASDIIHVEGFKNLGHFHRITPTISTISVDTEKIRKSIKEWQNHEKGMG